MSNKINAITIIFGYEDGGKAYYSAPVPDTKRNDVTKWEIKLYGDMVVSEFSPEIFGQVNFTLKERKSENKKRG